MRRIVFTLALFLGTVSLAQERLIDYVNPFIGTDGFGNVYPGAQIPFGGIQISPDTDDFDYDVAAGYKYNKPTIMGFSLTHLSGTGIPDLGDFLFVPGTGTPKSATGTDEDPDSGYRCRYSHSREAASPGYYTVDLLDYGVKAEMTTAARSGILRFTYPAADSAFVMIDLNHTLRWKCEWSSVRLLDEYTLIGSKIVAGWNPDRYVYFAARFSEPIRDFVILQDGEPVIYNTKRVEGKSFEQVRSEAESLWEKELGKYQLAPGCDRATRETFYTSVYRTAQHPFLFQDADGRFREHDKTIGKAEGWTNYTTFSLWDTYRAFHPLLNLVNQPLQADIANSMLAHFDKSTEKMLPIWSFYGGETWCMTEEGTQHYCAEIRRLQKKYESSIKVRLGIELDIRSEIDLSCFEYIIGAVHYVPKNGKYYPVDESRESFIQAVSEVWAGDYYAFAEDYYAQIAKIWDYTHCSVVAHFDLLTKYNEGQCLFRTDHPRYIESEIRL